MEYTPWSSKCHLRTIKLVLFIFFLCPTQQTVPGARYAPISWMGVTGELWLFGGYGYDRINLGTLNDLWQYSSLYDKWAWIGGNDTVNQFGVYGTRGSPSNSNIPGCRQNSISWNSNGTLWLFGGNGCASGGLQDYLNDLWQYNPSTNQWTWVSGSDTLYQPGVYGTQGTPSSTNIPGSRAYSVSWADSKGNLWLFGGRGYDSIGSNPGTLNDLWRYTPSTNQWTWISGSKLVGQPGVYGTQGSPSSSNTPGGRYGSISWIDLKGDLWLFGGAISSSDYMNDLWLYSPSTDRWTWVSGNYTANNRGIYGDLGIPSGANYPGGHFASISWIDSDGNLWFFGGSGYAAVGPQSHYLNDLWCYNPSANNWTWVRGSNSPNQPGVYGTLGTPSNLTIPGGRYGSVSWIDAEGKFWLFGGVIADGHYMNDLWQYSPSTNKWTWVSGNNTSNQVGIYISLGTAPFISPTIAPELVPPTQTPSQANVTENYAPVSLPSSIDPQVVVPSVVIPVVVTGIVVGVLVGLRKKIARKKTKTQSNPLALLPVDDRLVPYSSVILEDEIGAGSYGKVFSGKWRATRVAVKVGNAAISTEEFIKEAEFQMKIPPHPNIVQLLGVSIDGPKPLVILEYCNQGSLDRILFDTKDDIPAAMQLKIATGIARGLYHLHENNIVHRDLAARNVLLNNGEAKISDFGLSRKIKEETQVGKTASVVGPLRWMAPESLANQTYSKKSDVWSFGIVLYEITARLEPHIEEDILGIAVKIRDSTYTPRIAADCPAVLREIMEMCWQRDPNNRPTMELICENLDSAAI